MSKSPHIRWASESAVRVQELLDEGRNCQYIADCLGVHHEVIRRTIKKEGLEIYTAFDEINSQLTQNQNPNEWDIEDVLDTWQATAWDGGRIIVPKHRGKLDVFTLELYKYIDNEYGGLRSWLGKRCLLTAENFFKECNRCRQIKELREFRNQRGMIGGIISSCSKCCDSSRSIDAVYSAVARRRTRAKSLITKWGTEDRSLMLKAFGNACRLTGLLFTHDDHFIPVSTGHGGSYLGNMVPLAEILNRDKSDKNPFEWFAANAERFGLDQSGFDALVAKLAEQNGLTSEEFREYTYWCFANPRNETQIERDNARYGYRVTSVELWREATAVQAKQAIG